MDQERMGCLDKRLGEISRNVEDKIAGLRKELREEIRQAQVGLRSDIQILADGVLAQEELLATRQSKTLMRIDVVRASVEPWCQDLHRRMRILEEKSEQRVCQVLAAIREIAKP